MVPYKDYKKKKKSQLTSSDNVIKKENRFKVNQKGNNSGYYRVSLNICTEINLYLPDGGELCTAPVPRLKHMAFRPGVSKQAELFHFGQPGWPGIHEVQAHEMQTSTAPTTGVSLDLQPLLEASLLGSLLHKSHHSPSKSF